MVAPGQPWLDVLLISTAVAIIGVLTVPDDYFVRAMGDPVSRRGEAVEITSSSEVVATWGRGMGVLATIATHPVVAVSIAGALLLVFTIFLRGPGTFLEYLSLVSHALLIPALGTLVTVLVRLTTGAPTIGDLVLPGEPANFITALTFSIDPFIVWMLIVLGVGVQRVHATWATPRVLALLLGSYLVLLTASTALLYEDMQNRSDRVLMELRR